ncbi:MAG: nucleotidyltransferase family protein [Chloroflexi bacterium]|nr:nucleotidyltransferase family protein [Chloroflexota bacterium]
MKRDEVVKILKSNRQQLSERFGVTSVYLFGSIARDEGRPDSDIDLLIEFIKPIDLFEFIELQQNLESLLGKKVDLGTRRSLKLQYEDKVFEEAILVI